MNSLAKLQVSMFGFLVLVLAAFLVNILLLIPAIILLALQFLVLRGEVKRDYPEDWLRYSLVICVYEVMLLSLFYLMRTSQAALMNPATITNMLLLVMSVLIMTVVIRLLLGRKYCYGIVLFVADRWVGVNLRSDMFSRITEANYAVENPLKLKVKKGDRVRVRVTRGIGKSTPYELEGIAK